MARKNENYIVKTLNGMAYGFFASLIVGTILKQAGLFFNFEWFVNLGTTASSLMGPSIGVGVAYVLHAKGLNLICAAVAGAIGASLSGNPVSAYIATILAVELTKYVQGKTPVDILAVPLTSIFIAGIFTYICDPYIARGISYIGSLINNSVSMEPMIMGIIVSIVMGMALTAPISSAAIGIMLGLDGIAAGAALAGCCAQMVGFAVMSIDDNHIGEVIAIGIGTSMLQFKNIVKNLWIWVPPIITSAITGFFSAAVFHIQCTPIGSGMGTAGLVGLIECISVMGSEYWVTLILLDIVLPMGISYGIYKLMRKYKLIKKGDLKLSNI